MGAGEDKISRGGGEGRAENNKFIQKMGKYKKSCTAPTLFVEGTVAHILAHIRIWVYIYIYMYIYIYIYGAHLGAYKILGNIKTFQKVKKVNRKIQSAP